MGESFKDFEANFPQNRIQDFEDDFPKKVILKILNKADNKSLSF